MIARELVALAINLTYHARNAELMCQNGSIKHLMERVVRTKDPLLMKVRYIIVVLFGTCYKFYNRSFEI